MGRGRGRRDNDLIGQTVRISQGPYKGECVCSPAAPHLLALALFSYPDTCRLSDPSDYVSQGTLVW